MKARFVVRMAVRELRAAWTRLLFFFLCVAVGVAAIVGLRSVVQEVRGVLTREARALVGADIVLRSTHRWTSDELRQIESRVAADAIASGDLIETQTMAARVAGEQVTAARLVELRGVDDRFPFYGTLELAGGQTYAHTLLEDGGALVQPEILVQFDAAVGDTLRLGGRPFTIRGVITKDRVQRSGGLSLGPRVYVDLADMERTSILGFGSRASYQRLLRVREESVDRLTRQLRRTFRNDLISVRSWRGVEDRLGRNFTLAENYLSLVGFAMVVLGGIGVWSVTRVFVQQKIRSVAILKCLGASSRLVLATYGAQIAWLAVCGSVAGIALAAGALHAIPPRLLVPLNLSSVHVTLSAAAQGLAVGVLVSLLFALMPLLEMRTVKPLLLLRGELSAHHEGVRTETTGFLRVLRGLRGESLGADWQRAVTAAGLTAALVLVAIWQADSLRAGVYVSAGLAVVGLVLLGAGHWLVRLTRPLTRSRVFAVRHAVVSLGRPGNQTRVVLMAVGLGAFFILSMRAVQVNLLDEFTGQLSRNAPDLVLIDIQPGQVDGVRAAVAPYVTRPTRTWPMMRARVTAVAGRRVSLPNPEAVRRQGELTREFGITYRDALEDNERLIDGRFWQGPVPGDRLSEEVDTEVSIERMVHEEADVDVGDVMRFDVGGVTIRARVTSIRDVAWDETQNGGFVFVFRPGRVVERAPQTFVGFLKVPPGPEAAGALQRDLVRAFPNVSAIDVREILAAIQEVVDNATLGVTIVGTVTLFSGLLILVGAVAVTKFQRLYEAAIYRTLGAGTRVLAAMAAVEYGLLGVLAGVLAAAGATALSWLISTRLFEIDWRPAPGLLAAGVLLTALLVCVVGVAASLDVLVRKPLRTLRGE